MLSLLHIENIAVIESADISFDSGFNVLTGETGAGKSIVIDAISAILGERAYRDMIRTGTNKASVRAIFTNVPQLPWFEENGVPYDPEMVIQRDLFQDGKNICRVNDNIVTLGNLNKICRKLADIHGQYDHQSLLNPEYHISLVDLYRKDRTLPAKEQVSACYEQYSNIRNRLKDIISQANKDKREQDFMAFELQELEAADLQPGEDDILEGEISLLQNSEKIYEDLAGAYQIASEDDYSIISALKRVSDMLSETA